ncbi:MAG TPA: hypothetical protein VJ843_05405 [Candidatus Saccharimonadales bacterium]|nr:hypothetical protein [Candidatus Saccharimonadales bacterium]
MAYEAIPLENLPQDLHPDIMLANQFVWHGLQTYFRPGNAAVVQPALEYQEPFPATEDTMPAVPTLATFHTNGTFPSSFKGPWAHQVRRSIYPGYTATMTTIYNVETNLPEEIAPAIGPSPLIPNVIVSLDMDDALKVLRRTDLDDNERRYFTQSQYFFHTDCSAVRMDIFDTGEPQDHVVAYRPGAQEVQKLHDEMFGYSGCPCAVCVRMDHYGHLLTMPAEKKALLGLGRT